MFKIISRTQILLRPISIHKKLIAKMHTAQVSAWGNPPKYIEVPTPELPSKESGLVQVKVLAAGVHNVVRSRAAGMHFSATTLPHIPGADGVGITSSGELVYFNAWNSGSMSEIINVPSQVVTPLAEGSDPQKVAALLNPAMSSWMALRTRTQNLPKDFTVLILGVTSASGTIAINLARSLGAGKVIGVARNTKKLDALPLDQKIELLDPPENTDFSAMGDVDVVLDYVYGPATVKLLADLKPLKEVQYVEIGGLSASTMELPAALLRSKNVTLRGSAPGAWTMQQLGLELPNMLDAVSKLPNRELKVVKLKDIEKFWGEPKTEERAVVVP
jgi:NADPH:quinone reductase-like Zn-dependent oxidoreductase